MQKYFGVAGGGGRLQAAPAVLRPANQERRRTGGGLQLLEQVHTQNLKVNVENVQIDPDNAPPQEFKNMFANIVLSFKDIISWPIQRILWSS